MKPLLVLALVALAGVSAAWTNGALPDMMDARYDYAVCNVDYATDWLSMREDCADSTDVPVFDSSSYVTDLEDDLGDLEEAKDEANQVEFGLGMWQLGADSLELIGAVFQDAFTNKTGEFFSCVREGEAPLIEVHDTCFDAAMEKERDVSKDYVNNELEYANGQIAELQAVGADTSDMEEIVEDGETLVDDIDPAFDTKNPTEIAKLYARHSRLVLLFRLEQMVATIDYAKPIIEAGNNENKDEILSRGTALRDDTEELISECAYSADVENNFEYGRQNLECWDEALDLYQEFNALGGLILEGA
ncbi:MAG: hypothetical protein PHF60_04275 [Candidatus ainarchaeum sp.]|nr:hypothetical protein [Candidatus ainarchaeum sp.]